MLSKKFGILFCITLVFFIMVKNTQGSRKTEKATFAGGCFWCMEPPFEQLEGVVSVFSGYTGGTKKDPSYEEVTRGKTGHFEAIQITYEASKVSYKELLDVYWRQIDPTDSYGQFSDIGSQYKTAIFYHTDEQKKLALESKDKLERSGIFKKVIVTQILKYSEFYNAEDYHQDYYKKNPSRYERYKVGSGRSGFINNIWGNRMNKNKATFKKPSEDELRGRLTPLQYSVTQEDGTENPFDNDYWDNKKEGLYVDIVSGEVLFSSLDKFDSKTGWPSFTKPLESKNIIKKEDKALFSTRTEIRSKHANSHLGHVFNDGPEPTGLRYCINSASLRFIPKEDLEAEGYGQYKKLFK